MYRLYWHPNTSSCAPVAVLEERGMLFDLHEANYDVGEIKAPEEPEVIGKRAEH